MIEKTPPKLKWLFLVSLVSVILILFAGALIWDNLLKDEIQNQQGLAKIGYIPIDSKITPAQNITIKRVDWIEYLDHPDHYDIDLLIIGDSFSDVGYLPEYQASQNNYTVLALRTQEIQPVRQYSPINLLIALDNGGIIDDIHPRYILLESVPRALYIWTKSVDFNSNITHDEFRRALKTYYNAQGKGNSSSNQTPVLAKPVVIQNQTRPDAVTAGALPSWRGIYNIAFSKITSLNRKDPVELALVHPGECLVNIKQIIVSAIWLQFTGHTSPIVGQPYTSYRLVLDTPLFTSNRDPNVLYFLSEDLLYLDHVKEKGWLSQYNLYLNILSDRFAAKNITFSYMNAVNKFDLYHPRVISDPYQENPFYEDFEIQKKYYYYINPKPVLEKRLADNDKDIFFLGDTHWSWMAVESISSEISYPEPVQDQVSYQEIIDSLPQDPGVLKPSAEALAKAGRTEYAQEVYRRVFEIETGVPVSSVPLKKSSNPSRFGLFDGFTDCDNYYELSGWAIDPVHMDPAHFIIVTDKNQQVVSVGTITTKRPGVVTFFKNDGLLISGWSIRIEKNTLSKEAFPLKVYVLIPEETGFYPIASTKKVIDTMNKIS